MNIDYHGDPEPLVGYGVSVPAGAEGVTRALQLLLGWNCLATRDRGVGPAPVVRRRTIKHACLGYLELGRDVQIDARLDGGSFVILTPLSGVADLNVIGEHLSLRPGWAVALGEPGRVSLRLSANCRLLTLWVRRATLQSIVASLINVPFCAPLRFQWLMDPGDGHYWSFRELWHLVIKELDRPGALAEVQWQAENLEFALCTTLLYVLPHNYARNLVQGSDGGCSTGGLSTPTEGDYPSYLRDALRRIHEDPAAVRGIGQLASEVHITVRQLENAFTDHIGMKPLTYLRNLQLDLVYTALMEMRPGDETIESVARRHGFGHGSHFRKSYKARHGERPSDTLEQFHNSSAEQGSEDDH